MENDNYNVCFIIAHKYYRNYESHIQFYIDNIQNFYKNSLCIIVDNNSKYIQDIIEKLKNYNNIVILSNETNCNFELGAYRVGIIYLIEKKILYNYDYIIFSQDTFVIKNKYDFNTLKDNNIFAMSFGCVDDYYCTRDHYLFDEFCIEILKRINCQDIKDLFRSCWCCSFILHNSKVCEFLYLTNNIIVTNRTQSISTEVFFDAILYYFNNNKRYTLHYYHELTYNPYTINIKQDNIIEYFAKKLQQKNENTQD